MVTGPVSWCFQGARRRLASCVLVIVTPFIFSGSDRNPVPERGRNGTVSFIPQVDLCEHVLESHHMIPERKAGMDQRHAPTNQA